MSSSTKLFLFEACLGYLPKSPLYFIFGNFFVVDGHGDVDKAKHFIEEM